MAPNWSIRRPGSCTSSGGSFAACSAGISRLRSGERDRPARPPVGEPAHVSSPSSSQLHRPANEVTSGMPDELNPTISLRTAAIPLHSDEASPADSLNGPLGSAHNGSHYRDSGGMHVSRETSLGTDLYEALQADLAHEALHPANRMFHVKHRSTTPRSPGRRCRLSRCATCGSSRGPRRRSAGSSPSPIRRAGSARPRCGQRGDGAGPARPECAADRPGSAGQRHAPPWA